MASSSLRSAIGRLRGSILLHHAESVSDGQLLESFLTQKDDDAFEAIVRRHGPMVLTVSRRIVGNGADAEDVFQATFLVLLRKASTIRPSGNVGPWLHGVAYRTACKARAEASRRKAREQQAPPRPMESSTALEHQDWLPLLDRELNRLSAKHRIILILCDLQGLPRRDVASRLRISEGTLSSRLARARAILGNRLRRRGVALSAAFLALGRSASAEVPISLIAATAASVAAARAGQAVTATVQFLFHGVLQTMAIATCVRIISVGLLVLALGAGAGSSFFLGGLQAQKPGNTGGKSDKPNQNPKPASADKPAADKPPAGPEVNGTVKSVDESNKTITVMTNAKTGTKLVAEETYPLSADVEILLQHGLKKETKPGKLTEVTAGAPVFMKLTADSKSVAKISVGGGSQSGTIKAVNSDKRTITVSVKEDGKLAEKTFELMQDATIILDDGVNTKKQPPKEGAWTDLSEGNPVVLHLSGYHRKLATRVIASGPTIAGTIQGVDAGNNTITVSFKENGGLVEKTLPVLKEVRFKGNLGEIVSGTSALLRLSVSDRKTVVGIQLTVE
jgi:RNA polymerase sigma factor (sigma-70 family)